MKLKLSTTFLFLILFFCSSPSYSQHNAVVCPYFMVPLDYFGTWFCIDPKGINQPVKAVLVDTTITLRKTDHVIFHIGPNNKVKK